MEECFFHCLWEMQLIFSLGAFSHIKSQSFANFECFVSKAYHPRRYQFNVNFQLPRTSHKKFATAPQLMHLGNKRIFPPPSHFRTNITLNYHDGAIASPLNLPPRG